MKYSIKIPTYITEAYDINKENGNTLWRNAVKRKMVNVSVAFEVLEMVRNHQPHTSRHPSI